MSYQALQKSSRAGDDDQQFPHQLVNELHFLALRTLLSLLGMETEARCLLVASRGGPRQ